MAERETTKVCRECGCTRLRQFPSLRYKQCDECLAILPWELEPGQKPLIGSSRDAYRETDR